MWRHSERLGDVLVALADALVTADLGVLPFPLFHERQQLRIVALRDRLGLHLDVQLPAGLFNGGPDLDDGLLEPLNAVVLVQTRAGQDVERRRDESDLDLGLGGVFRLSLREGFLDSVDAFVAEACDLDIGTDLDWLGSETLADVGE